MKSITELAIESTDCTANSRSYGAEPRLKYSVESSGSGQPDLGWDARDCGGGSPAEIMLAQTAKGTQSWTVEEEDEKPLLSIDRAYLSVSSKKNRPSGFWWKSVTFFRQPLMNGL